MKHRILLLLPAAALAAVALSADGLGARSVAPTTEVVVTLKAPPLAVFGRSLLSASHEDYLRRLEAAQDAVVHRVRTFLPEAQVRWRYHLVADGFAVALPRDETSALARIPGVAEVWPNVRYHALGVSRSARAADVLGPQQIGADKLWGPTFATAGNGMKIGIIDDGLDASNPYFNPSGFQYPAGFPKGQTAYTTPKVIVARTFAPAGTTYRYANAPFDPTASFHATHVAGIAAGDYGTNANGISISGVAPNAQIGNYKALTIPTPGFGLDGNSAEIAAAIEAAVADGMNVINLSLGEPEVEPSRDIVVAAIDGAAAAGVVPAIAAGNDFQDFGYGTVSSPGNAPAAITAAAVTASDTIADFSSAGPTPLSLQFKPDVSAPGVHVLSSLPPNQGGPFNYLDGTSMASPHVAGAAALLKERHPTWTVAEIKSALVQTGDPVQDPVRAGAEAWTTREGGGLIDLVKADNPLLFAAPTGLSFGELAPGASATQNVALSDAGGGAGDWTVAVAPQQGAATVTAPATVTVPGALAITAVAGAAPGDATGFVVLTQGSNVRRIPYWLDVSAPKLGRERALPLTRAGTYEGTTVGGASLVSAYRYPTGRDTTYPGPERVYRFTVKGTPANVGFVVLSGHAVPHVTYAGSEDRLAGYTALPIDLNPYRTSWNASRAISGLVLPVAGTYDVVFDTRSPADAGKFTFRYWVNDTTPPSLHVASRVGGIAVSAVDKGSGVDPASIAATLDGRAVAARWTAAGVIRITARPGRHRLVLRVSDYQETKNMEDVGPILPNTATLRATVTVARAVR